MIKRLSKFKILLVCSVYLLANTSNAMHDQNKQKKIENIEYQIIERQDKLRNKQTFVSRLNKQFRDIEQKKEIPDIVDEIAKLEQEILDLEEQKMKLEKSTPDSFHTPPKAFTKKKKKRKIPKRRNKRKEEKEKKEEENFEENCEIFKTFGAQNPNLYADLMRDVILPFCTIDVRTGANLVKWFSLFSNKIIFEYFKISPNIISRLQKNKRKHLLFYVLGRHQKKSFNAIFDVITPFIRKDHFVVTYEGNPCILMDSNGNGILHKAVQTGQYEIVQKIISLIKKHTPEVTKNLIINMKNSNGLTPLHIAQDKQLQHIVTLLLKHGANNNIEKNIDYYNKLNKKGKTPLHTACIKKNQKNVEALLNNPNIDINKYSTPNSHNFPNSCEGSPLHFACKYGHTNIVKILLQHPNIDVNKSEPVGVTPLHFACRWGHTKIAKLLLKHPNIDVNKSEPARGTPLLLAVFFNNRRIVKILLEHPDIDVSKTSGNPKKTPLQLAEEQGYSDIAYFLSQKDNSVTIVENPPKVNKNSEKNSEVCTIL